MIIFSYFYQKLLIIYYKKTALWYIRIQPLVSSLSSCVQRLETSSWHLLFISFFWFSLVPGTLTAAALSRSLVFTRRLFSLNEIGLKTNLSWNICIQRLPRDRNRKWKWRSLSFVFHFLKRQLFLTNCWQDILDSFVYWHYHRLLTSLWIDFFLN